jgi:hypothetical protein
MAGTEISTTCEFDARHRDPRHTLKTGIPDPTNAVPGSPYFSSVLQIRRVENPMDAARPA